MAKSRNSIDLSALPITFQQEIPESYLDRMGHMNVAWYTHLFSHATGSFFELFGMDAAYMQSNNAGSFALESHVRYLSEVRAGQHVTLRTRALARTQKRLHFMHFMVNDESSSLAATCEFVGAHIDMTVRRMSPLAEHVAANYDRLLAAHQRIDWQAPLCGSMNP